jgi:N-acetylglucosaminyldiphosphoundecaprenol N-acetyl-beta-D-mannosaminyltransferase
VDGPPVVHTGLEQAVPGGVLQPESRRGHIPRVDVLGVGISCTDIPGVVDCISEWIADREGHYVCVTGMHGVMESRDDSELREIHNRSGLTTPDGMPMVWASRWAGIRQARRVYGPDLMAAVMERGTAHGWRSYFLGGAPGVADQFAARIRSKNPDVQIVGCYSLPFRALSPAEDAALVDELNRAQPDIIWVGLGTPKQERWMASHLHLVAAPVLVGVGAAFDFGAGTVRQAPRWMQRSGFEWLFRLAMEPRRLWRRYVYNIPRFLVALARTPPKQIDQA